MVRRVLCIALLVLLGCKTSEVVVPTDFTTTYPIAEGNSWIFRMRETIYIPGLDPINREAFYRETIGREIEVGTFVLNKALFDSTNNIALIPQLIQSSPEGIIIKDGSDEKDLLKFPIFENSTWDNGDEKYTISNFEKNTNTGDFSATLIWGYDSSAINLTKNLIQFKNKLGPSYMLFEQYEYCQETPDCIGKEIISSGVKQEFILESTSENLPF